MLIISTSKNNNHLSDLKKSVKTKLIIMGLVPILLFVFFNVFYTIPSIRRDIFHEKEIQTREMVNIGESIVNHYYQMEQQGVLTRNEAQEAAKEAIGSIRFGDDKLDYFWINDFHPKMIMHPFRPDLEGEDISGFKDPDGLHLFVEFVKTAEKDGAGFVPYKWQYYDDANRIEEKLSYVTSFAQWDWIIGTGVYLNDVQAIVSTRRNTNLIMLTVIALLTISIIIYASNQAFVKPLRQLIGEVARVGDGDFTGKVDLKSQDEFGFLAETVNKMIGSLSLLLANATGIMDKTKEASENVSASTEEMNASLEEVASTSNVFSENAHSLGEKSQLIADDSKTISKKASTGQDSINQAVSQIERIAHRVSELKDIIMGLDNSSQEIGSIVETIKGIADQTNMLALNAAIEAARAGEQGQGFAVVAEEVRKLAEESATAATNITNLIEVNQNQSKQAVTDMEKGVDEVNAGKDVILSTGEIFNTIINGVGSLTGQIENLNGFVEEISSGSEEISAAVEEQSATMNEIATTTQDLQFEVDKLSGELSRFKFKS